MARPLKTSIKPQSIDGITTTTRQQYLRRQSLHDSQQPFISMRPHLASKPIDTQMAHPAPKARQYETVAGVVIPKLKPLKIPEALRQDVVVKLPRRWSIRASVFSLLQYVVLAGVAVGAGYSTNIGQWFVLAFAIYALVTRRDSRLAFGIALFVLVSVPLFQIINQPGVSNNMAVYVYELLVVGTVQALIELKWPPRQRQAER